MKSIGPNAIDRLPLDPVTRKPLQSKAQPGYYPGYSTLDQQGFWDAATRAVVLKRVQEVPPIRFFTAEEAHLLKAVCDHILPQDDRDFAHRIPIVPFIDKRLHDNRTDGFRFEDMPPDREAHRLGIKAINQMARELFSRDFLELSWLGQEELLLLIHDANSKAAQNVWKRLPVDRYWAMLVQDCVEVYYAHPWTWDEIGYGGPAYPRAYMRLERGEPEPWEVEERRYDWEAPSSALSDPLGIDVAENSSNAQIKQGGTR
jgi:catechol 2,3-dioxygenase-like lactoylglutathione lyase family enzyme